MAQDCHCWSLGWMGWRDLKALPAPWFDELARILAMVEEGGVCLEGLLDAYCYDPQGWW